MELSLFLAKVLGLYLVIVCLAVLAHPKEVEKVVNDFAKNDNRMFMFFSGAMLLLLGLALVVGHNIWEMSWRGLITFFGWMTVFKGTVRLFAPHEVVAKSVKIVKSGIYRALLLVFLLIGVWLVNIGFSA